MIALIALLLIVTGFGLVAAWIGANPGMVSMTWMGYQIESSVAVLLAAVLLVSLAVMLVYNLLRKLIIAPLHYTQRRDIKQYQRALAQVTHSVAALAAGDMDAASRHTRKAEKALGTTPLTLMLKAQISKSQGSDDETRQLLEQLLEHPETEYLAAKSLSDAAQKQQRLPQALKLAERAHKVNPHAPQGAWAVFNLQLEDGHFQEAEAQARQARKRGAFTRADLANALGRLALKQAENSSANGHKENALAFAKTAVGKLHGNVAAAELCSKLYVENNQPEKALGLIQAQWKIAPSATLAGYFNDIVHYEKPARKEKLIAKLEASNPTAVENQLLH